MFRVIYSDGAGIHPSEKFDNLKSASLFHDFLMLDPDATDVIIDDQLALRVDPLIPDVVVPPDPADKLQSLKDMRAELLVLGFTDKDPVILQLDQTIFDEEFPVIPPVDPEEGGI